jgi:putative glycosyltransferase (TIGR04372 family)
MFKLLIISFKKIIIKTLYFLFFLLSPFLFILIIFLKPIIIVRIVPIMTNRYGHLAMNPEVYLVEKNMFKFSKKYLDLFFYSRYGICNYELFYLVKKNITIFPYFILEPVYNFIKKFFNKKINNYTIINFSQKVTDSNFYLDKFEISLKLSEDQINICKDILVKNYISEKDPFICIFNRDDAYLNSFRHKKDWYYLSHHNYDINKFSLSAELAANKNINVFRMGSKVEKEFNSINKNKRIIDYANSKFRSELMDIYLASKCLFGISSGTGNSQVAIVFRRPILDLNANLHHLFTYKKDSILLSKHYFSKREKRYLTLKEILKYNINELATRNQLDNAGIEMIDCGDDEIASAVLELVDRLSGKWTDTEYNLDLQRRFKKIYSQWMGNQYVNGHKWHGDIIRANYSTNFLIKNIEWLNE